jgi:hypothetical protein
MKKIESIIILVVIVAVFIASCGTRELCPAYSKVVKKSVTARQV